MEGHMFDAAINTAFNALGNIPTVLADIGPCKIKIDTQKNILPGYYCPKCHLPLSRGDYSYQKDILICHGCREISLKGSDVDSAKEIFIQTRFQK